MNGPYLRCVKVAERAVQAAQNAVQTAEAACVRRLFYQSCRKRLYPLAATLLQTPSRSTMNNKERSNRVPKPNQSSSVKHRTRFVTQMHIDLSCLVVDTLQFHHTRYVSLLVPVILGVGFGCSGPKTS